MEVLLTKGVRSKLGNGLKVRVWNEPWLRDQDNFFIESPVIPELQDIVVNDLFIPGCSQWDEELLHDMFTACDVDAILNIPLSYSGFEDRRIWHFTKNGIYSVKSGYHLANSFEFDASFNSSIAGSKLWKIRVPPKFKHFAWRACKDYLPTSLNLQAKGVPVDGLCVLCGDSFENTWHLFVSCRFAKSCWSEFNQSLLVEHCANRAESLMECFFKMINMLSDMERSKFIAVAWSIWKQRNNKLWNASLLTPAATVFNALDYLFAWIAAKQLHVSPSPRPVSSQCFSWHCPPSSYLKCNIDAAFFGHEKIVGVGMVLRNDCGQFLNCRTKLFQGLYNVAEGEAMGLQEALAWIRNLGFQRILFEMDAKTVCDAVQSSSLDMSEFGSIIAHCKLLLSQLPFSSVCFANRRQNDVAHCVAKAAILYSSPMTWVETPSFLGSLLQNICTDPHS